MKEEPLGLSLLLVRLLSERSMSPALGPPGRSWSARSLGSSGAAIPTTPTAITEHPARLHEPTKHETPTQLACPLRSRYVWSGETTAASRSPSVGSPAGKQRRGGGNGNGGLAGGGSVGEQQQPHQQPQRRYVHLRERERES